MNVQVNPEILRWARNTAGLGVEEAAHSLGFRDGKRRTAVKRLEALEAGREFPSVSVLDRMAKRYYRPAIVFYLPRPPEEEEAAARFRSAPKGLTPAEQGVLNAFVRNLRSRQDQLRDALEGGDAGPVAWIGSATERTGRETLATRIREVLRLNLDEYRAQRDTETAFGWLRARVEAAGAFVILQGDLGSRHSAMDTRLFRGLSLADSVAPFIVINPYDATGARSFTLLHEMTHLLLGQNEFADLVSEDRLERLCNDVAGDVLLPARDVQGLAALARAGLDELAEAISDAAKRWRVSNSLVAFRASRLGYLRRDDLYVLLRRFESRWRGVKGTRAAGKRKEGGPSFHVVHRYRLGNSLVRRVRELWRAGELSTTRAAAVLGVRAMSVHGLLEPSRR